MNPRSKVQKDLEMFVFSLIYYFTHENSLLHYGTKKKNIIPSHRIGGRYEIIDLIDQGKTSKAYRGPI